MTAVFSAVVFIQKSIKYPLHFVKTVVKLSCNEIFTVSKIQRLENKK